MSALVVTTAPPAAAFDTRVKTPAKKRGSELATGVRSASRP